MEDPKSQSLADSPTGQLFSGDINTSQNKPPSEGPINELRKENDAINSSPEKGELATRHNDEAPWSIWTPRQKKIIILSASFASLLSPLSGQIYFPALNSIANDLHVSDALVNLSITTYMIFQGLAPTFTAQLSDTAGRRPSYIVCFIIYMAANIGLASQDSYAALLVLRCLQSAGSSGTVALASAIAADLVTSAERGVYISYASAIPMLGPTLGPIIGGILAQGFGWHAIFWFLLVLVGVVAVPMALFFPETCRSIVGDGSIPPPKWNRCYTNVLWERHSLQKGQEVRYDKRDELARTRRIRLPNPFATIILLFQRECGFALLYSGILLCSVYATVSLIPSQFGRIYNFNELQISLCFIPFGVGTLIAAFSRGRVMDSNFRRHERKLGIQSDRTRRTDLTNFPIERARIEVALPTILVGSACTIGFGWTLHFETNLVGPLILLFVIAFCISSSGNCIGVLMVDLYPGRAGTVTATSNLTRCLLGAGATAVVIPMINSIGIGWTTSFFGFLNLAATPLLWYIMKEGPNWRAEARQKKLDHQAKDEEANRDHNSNNIFQNEGKM